MYTWYIVYMRAIYSHWYACVCLGVLQRGIKWCSTEYFVRITKYFVRQNILDKIFCSHAHLRTRCADQREDQNILFQKRDNLLSRRIFGVIDALKKRLYVDPSRIRLHVVKQRSGVQTTTENTTYCESRFMSLLIEDKSRHGMSHVEMLCHVHKKIQLKMSDYDWCFSH